MSTALTPLPHHARLRRLSQLYAGLIAYGVSLSLMVRGGLGLDPWDVFHQGLSHTWGLGIGNWTIIVGAAVLLLWWPLRQRPGLGTLSNVVVIGLVVDLVLAVMPVPHAMALRVLCLVAGVTLNAVATGAYIGAGLGPGPRDGLTTGMAERGHSIRVIRTAIELTVLAGGGLLGGTVGVGTLAYALAIGPLTHVTIPALTVGGSAGTPGRRRSRGRRPLVGEAVQELSAPRGD